MGISSARSDGGRAAGASGMSAERPRPRAGRLSAMLVLGLRGCRFAREEFARQRQIGFGAARLGVIDDAGQAVARRLAEAHVPRDDGVEHAFLEEGANVARDLLTEIGAFVVH